jgi:DNA-binding MarR family transcriptional regulator
MKVMSSRFNPDDFSLGELTTYQVGTMQATANRALKKHGDDLLKEYGITNMQWHIVGTVLDAGDKGARISDLARLLDTTMAFLTTNVNLLEARGILKRSENRNDARSRIVTVSPAFKPTCEKIESSLRAKLRSTIYTSISPEELRTYIKVLAKLAEVK